MATMNKTVANSTGSVVGGYAAQPCSVALHGWFLSNTGASTYLANFYVPADKSVNNAQTTVPSASGTLLFSIQVPANSSKEFYAGEGIYFKDGLFVQTSNAALTGVVVYS
ncbi:MAG: hypothetical protein KGI71_05660 [Patescibacteria group bacterium]|nr:hypothetical protein [Patescibacteria group bacterium]